MTNQVSHVCKGKAQICQSHQLAAIVFHKAQLFLALVLKSYKFQGLAPLSALDIVLAIILCLYRDVKALTGS